MKSNMKFIYSKFASQNILWSRRLLQAERLGTNCNKLNTLERARNNATQAEQSKASFFVGN